jgi:hypothetical protein
MIVKNSFVKYLILSAVIILLFTHGLQVFINGFSKNQFALPIFIIAGLAVFTGRRSLYSVFFFLFGVGAILTIKDLAHMAGASFFLCAVYYKKNNITLSASFILIIISYLLSYYLNGHENYINLIEGIIGNSVFFIFLYTLFIKQPSKIDHLSKVTPLDKRQLLIMKYLSLDIPRKQIPDTVPEKELWKHDIDNFTLDIVNSEIAKMKKILDIKSEFSLGVWYTKKIEIPE